MNAINSIKYKIGRLLESSPFTWWLAWTSAHYLVFLLPHDSSYYALKHFGGRAQKLFVDVGANAGISALSFRQINKTDPILSIEPNPIHEPSLSRLKKRLRGFDYHLVAAGRQPDSMNLFMPIYKKVPLHTFASTSELQVRNAIAASYPHISEKSLRIVVWTVKVVSLDSMNLAPAILKVDAEGADFEVLLGAEATIAEWRPYIMIEACHEDMARFRTFFTERNYQLLSYDSEDDCFHPLNNQLSYKSGSRNVFAIPREFMDRLPVR